MQIVRPLRHRREVYATAARELHLWLLQVMAWVASRVRLPRILRLDFQDEIRKARRDIRVLIFLGMCSRMTFHRRDIGTFTRRPHGIAGYQRRHARLLRIYTRGIPLRTLREMRDALAKFDKVVKCAIARLPKRGVTPGAIVAVIAVRIALGASAPAPAAEAADTS
jgi:hypothetical protein